MHGAMLMCAIRNEGFLRGSNKDMLRASNYLSSRIPMAARPHSFRHSICSLYFLGSHTLRKPDRESKWLVSSKKGVGPAIPCV